MKMVLVSSDSTCVFKWSTSLVETEMYILIDCPEIFSLGPEDEST